MGYNRYMIAENMNWILRLPNFFKRIIIGIINLGSSHHWNMLSRIFPKKIIPSQLGDKLYKLVKILKDEEPDFYRILISTFDYPDSYMISGTEEKGIYLGE